MSLGIIGYGSPQAVPELYGPNSSQEKFLRHHGSKICNLQFNIQTRCFCSLKRDQTLHSLQIRSSRSELFCPNGPRFGCVLAQQTVNDIVRLPGCKEGQQAPFDKLFPARVGKAIEVDDEFLEKFWYRKNQDILSENERITVAESDDLGNIKRRQGFIHDFRSLDA